MLLHGISRSVAAILWTLALLPLQLIAVRLPDPVSGFIPQIYHRGAARIIGLQINVDGEPARTGPALYVANHSSWLDIIVLGSILRAGFVAKSEVSKWPAFGTLARLQRTIFVSRDRHKTRQGTDEVSQNLAAGRPLILFPEGTSNNGVSVLPFRSSFFSVVENEATRATPVQPVSISYVSRGGLPVVRSAMPQIAWYGDMTLLPHLWRLFCEGGKIAISVKFHPLPDIQENPSRKVLAASCHEAVLQGVSNARRFEA